MSSGYTNINPNITVESVPCFSASFACAKVAPVSALLLSGIESGRFDLSVKLYCEYKNVKIFSFERRYHGKNCEMYDSLNGGRMLIRFNFSDFSVNYKFLNSLEKAFSCDIVAEVGVNNSVYEMRNPINILAFDEFYGIESHPETLCTFVNPDSKKAAEFSSECGCADEWTSFAEASEIADNIIRNIRKSNIICVKRDGYSPEKRQTVTSIDTLAGKSSVVATPVELAVLFCSAAERCGLDTLMVFVKNTMGIVSIYCGVIVNKEAAFCISESMTKLRAALEKDEIFLLDPAVLSSAQNLDIEHASFLASEIMHKASTDIILAVGIGKCLKNILGTDYTKISIKADARAALGEIYSGLSAKASFKLFGGDYYANDVIPLVGFDEEGFMRAYEEKIMLRPMEISEKVADFRDISDNFASFAFSGFKKKEYNKNEMLEVTHRYDEFKSRIKSKSFAVAGVYEKVFHERVSRMCYGSVPGTKNYVIAGFMRMNDVRTAETLYIPLAFAEAELLCSYDYYFKLKNSGLTVNSVLASFAEGSDVQLTGADTVKKVYEIFEKIAEDVSRSGEYSEVSVIREFAIVKADLSDAVLWDDIRRNGKKMLANGNFADIITCKKQEKSAESEVCYTFPRFVPASCEKALYHNGNVVLEGSSVREKSDMVVNKAVYSLSEGKKIIVTSENESFINEIYGELEKEGLAELMLKIDGRMTSLQLSEIISKRIAELSESPINPSSGILTDFDMIYKRLQSYSDALSVQDPVLGITVPDGILSYFRACDAKDGSEITTLNVKDNAFSDMTQHKFNVLFDRAEKLVEAAENAMKSSGLYISAPLKEHPLYPIVGKCSFDEDGMQQLFDIISKINSVLSDYRDTFYDVSELIGIDISDVKDIKGMYSLNELYKLVIAARELEIPDDVSGSDMTGFASGVGKLKTELGRAENIEYRLRFFGKEIFEDVDTLLSGYSPSDAGQGNFIKKFLVKKNNKDVLLQYVPDERRSEFNQHNVEDIYRLLEEYRRIKASTSITDSYLGKENSVKLAEVIKNAEELLEDIYAGITDDEKLLSDKIGKLFGFVKLVSEDTALSKKLTYARAKFAQVCSENDCLLSELKTRLNADFSELKFDSGILGYDGLSSYLKELERNLPAIDIWNAWLDAKNAADEFMPEFSAYIESGGIKEHTDRVFAASLILPSVGYLIKKYDIIKHKKNFENARTKYAEVYEKARKLSSVNAVLSYKQRLCHFIETENLSSISADAGLPLRVFVKKYKKAILTIFPVVFADAYDIGFMFGGEAEADVLIAGAFENTETALMSCAAAVKSVFLVKYASENGILSDRLARALTLTEDISYNLYASDRMLGALTGNNCFFGYGSNIPEFSVMNVNGTMRRVNDGANSQEAQCCVSKAAELYTKSGKSVGIFTLTHGQAAYIKHLLNLTAENDRKLAEGVENGDVSVFEPSAVCFRKFDTALISLGAAVDTNGSIGWSFGYGDVSSYIPAFSCALNCAAEKTIVVCSLTVKEITKLRSSSYEAEKLFFAVISASKGVTVMDAGEYSSGASEFSDLLVSQNESLVPAAGRFAAFAEGYDIGSGCFHMYDCDASGNVSDRLYQSVLLAENGIGCKTESVLDTVLEKLGMENGD